MRSETPGKHLNFWQALDAPAAWEAGFSGPTVLSHTLLLAGTTSELSESLTPKLQVKHGEALTRRDTEGDEGDGRGQHITEMPASAGREAPTWPPGGARAVGRATPGAAENAGSQSSHTSPEADLATLLQENVWRFLLKVPARPTRCAAPRPSAWKPWKPVSTWKLTWTLTAAAPFSAMETPGCRSRVHGEAEGHLPGFQRSSWSRRDKLSSM